MKKSGIFVVCFLLVVFLAGCSCSKESTWETGANYEVFNTGSTEKKEFQYQVFDNQHNTIDSDNTEDKEPIFYVNDRFLRLSLNYGTGATFYRYYDVSNGQVSEMYQTILSDRFTDDGILVVYLTHEDDTVVVAIQDAFDENVLYKTFKGEFPIKFSPTTQAEFISDNQVKITYFTDGDTDYNEITELFTFR